MTTPKLSATPVSEETQVLVDQKMMNEPDAIKQKVGELIDLIKKQAKTDLSSADQMTQEAYNQAISQAKATLKTTEVFFQEQSAALDQSLQDLNDSAGRQWDSFIADVKGMGDRLDRAVNAAWATLKEDT